MDTQEVIRMNPAQAAHTAKLNAAKKACEQDGKIKEDKIQEWALLDICEWLQGIHYQVTMLNVPRPGRGSGYPK